MSTLAPSATLSSSSSCPTGQLPDLTGGSSRTCAVGVYSERHSVDDAVDAMRSCCGDSVITILDGGCGLSCEAGADTQSCLIEHIRGVECSGGSIVIVSSGGGAQTTSAGGSGQGSASSSSGTTTDGGSGITGGGQASQTSATGASQSTGAAPLMDVEFASKRGVFVAGFLAMGLFSGAMLL